MRWLLVLMLAGCAAPQPTELQLALVAYYKDRCEKQGVPQEAMRGCMWQLYQADVNSSSPQINAVQGMGQVLQSTPYPRQLPTTDFACMQQCQARGYQFGLCQKNCTY